MHNQNPSTATDITEKTTPASPPPTPPPDSKTTQPPTKSSTTPTSSPPNTSPLSRNLSLLKKYCSDIKSWPLLLVALSICLVLSGSLIRHMLSQHDQCVQGQLIRSMTNNVDYSVDLMKSQDPDFLKLKALENDVHNLHNRFHAHQDQNRERWDKMKNLHGHLVEQFYLGCQERICQGLLAEMVGVIKKGMAVAAQEGLGSLQGAGDGKAGGCACGAH